MTGKDRGLSVQHCYRQAENTDPKPKSHVFLQATCIFGYLCKRWLWLCTWREDFGESPGQGGHSKAGGLITGSSFHGILPFLFSFLGVPVLYKLRGREPKLHSFVSKTEFARQENEWGSLVLTRENKTFLDFDFSSLRPEEFQRSVVGSIVLIFQ